VNPQAISVQSVNPASVADPKRSVPVTQSTHPGPTVATAISQAAQVKEVEHRKRERGGAIRHGP
jgi:hypothetical protein